MLHPSYTDLMKVVNKDVEEGETKVVNSRYSIVMATAKRAREIIDGSMPVSYTHLKLQNVASKVSSDFDKKGIQELYQQLMSMSRKLQYQQLVKAGALGRLPFIEIDSLGVEKARVVFQGMEGAYGQAAMKTYFGEDCNSYRCV